MSILSLPRIHFQGATDWSPSTANNHNDVYDVATVAPVLQKGVTYANFLQWLKTLNPGSSGADVEVWGSWNVFGDHAVRFTNAAISGIQLSSAAGASGDPLQGCAINICGLRWTGGPGPARLVMTDPLSYGENTSQIFYRSLVVGNPTLGGGDPPVGFSAQGVGPMFSKWGYPNRNLGIGSNLVFEGGRSCCWWAGLPNANIQWFGLDQSPALAALKSAAEANGNQGLLIRFASYFTQYYVAASWNGNPIRSGSDLVKAHKEGFTGDNPSRSMMLGSIGIWEPGELSSAPTDLPLTPGANALLQRGVDPPYVGPIQPFALGPAMAKVDATRNVVVLDLINAIPEADNRKEKADLGTLELYMGSSKIADLPFARYNQAAYLAAGGIVEFPIPGGVAPEGPITLVQPQPSGQQAVLAQSEFLAETDQWGVYLDQRQTSQVTLTVMQNGEPAPAGVSLYLAQYDSRTNTPIASPVVSYLDPNGQPLAHPIAPVSNGKAIIRLQPIQSGSCLLGVFAFAGTPPTNLPQANFPFPNYFYFCVRVLPFDDELERNTPDSRLTWSFIYSNVLRTFDLIYPAMSQVRNLDSLPVVEGMAVQIKAAVALSTFESTLYMPITRDLSAGKRKLLQRFINLLPDIPQGPGGTL